MYLATLSAYHDAFDPVALREFIAQDFVQNTIRRETLDTLAENGPLDTFLSTTKANYIKSQLPTIQSNLKAVADSGIAIAVGPDTGIMGAFPGISVHREMELMVQAGLTPLQVLEAGTRKATECLGLDDVGTIAEGKVADLVILNGDPLEDIRTSRNIAAVIKGGSEVARDKLLADLLSDS
jgi:imidazolonepropionase-like amidohydrolase